MSANANLMTVTFRNHPVENVKETKAKGRPIFDDIEVCDFTFAGNRQTKSTFMAHEAEPNATREAHKSGDVNVVTYAMVYNEQYRKFKAGEAQTANGTPLSELPFLTEGKRRELKALHIHTAEALAALDGNPLKQLGMGGRELKNNAQAYLDNAAGSADVIGLTAKVEALTKALAEEQKLRQEMIDVAVLRRENGDLSPLPGATDDTPVNPDGEHEAVEPTLPDVPTLDELETWDVAQMKEFLFAYTGQRPKGNPSKKALTEAVKELAGI